MRQKFFTNTIQSKFIKNLLLNTSIPIINSVRDGDYIINGYTYLYNYYLIKCTKSGTLGATDSSLLPEFKTSNNNFMFGQSYTKYTYTYNSNSLAYDSDTHKYLGDYLRFYRDIFKIDLMPFYNCFNGVYTSKFYIDTKNNVIKQNFYDSYSQGSEEFNDKYYNKDIYKIALVPIKFNKKYTIALDCDSLVSIAPCFINKGQLLKINYGSAKIDFTYEYNKLYNSITNFINLKFHSPESIIIENNLQTLVNTQFRDDGMALTGDSATLTLEQLFQRYEQYLYLMIQLPIDNISSIVVLEGDYADRRGKQIFNIEYIDYIDDDTLNDLCLSDLSLLNFNDNTRYPFADRLIEYLLWNTIDNNDDISENTVRIQNLIGTDFSVHPKGHFDKFLRARLFSTFRDSKRYTNIDINGFVDKDIESYLYR